MTSSTARVYPNNPNVRSTAWAGRQLILREIARPTADPATSPMPTPTTTQAMPIATFAVGSSTLAISSGASRIAATAPATAATRVNMAAMRPCRNPEIAAPMSSTMTTASTMFIAASPGPPRAARPLTGSSCQVRECEITLAIPRHGPAAEGEQGVDQPGGEAPDDQLRHPEGRSDESARVLHLSKVQRINQLADRHPGDRRRLGQVRCCDATRFMPVGQHGGHEVTGRRQIQIGQQRRRGDRRRLESGLLGSLPQRGADRVLP